MLLKISKMILYDEPSVPEIQLEDIAEFAKKTFKVSTETRDSVFSLCDKDSIYYVAASRIQKLHVPFQRHMPLPEEVEFERNTGSVKSQSIVCYDGFELQNALGKLIPKEELSEDVFHIVFTNKLVCTYDYTDYRYHGRALIGSNPALISTTGIIEAPAKPREYYTELIAHSRAGINVDALKEKFRGTFLEYHDPRLSQIVQGYVLQAIFYYETQEAFCDRIDCRLYNAHWQKELLHSQIEVGKLCERHQDILESLTMV